VSTIEFRSVFAKEASVADAPATGADRRTRPLQKDVAAHAGVSRTTVSLVLNKVAGVAIPEETRQRVWQAAEELGFVPDGAARSLRGAKSNILGLLTSEIATTPYAVEIIKGVQDHAFERGQTLLIIDTEGSQRAAADAVARLNQWRADGLIFAADYHRRVELPPGIGDLPTVLVDCFADGVHPVILPDEVQGGRLATETLLAAGHRRIGFINGPEDLPASRGRLAGFADAHRAAGLSVDPVLVRNGDWWQESAARHTADLMDLADPPTALFCGNDWMAMGCYDALRERGLRVPEDVSVIGFDNRVEIADHMRPRLTTIALPYREMGRLGVEFLLDRPAVPTAPVLVTCPLVERDSIAPPARR
jgi:LacI family transcriptional regulator